MAEAGQIWPERQREREWVRAGEEVPGSGKSQGEGKRLQELLPGSLGIVPCSSCLPGPPPTDVPLAGVFLRPGVAAPRGVPGSLCRALCGQAPGQPAGSLRSPHESLHHVRCRDSPAHPRVPLPTPGTGPWCPDPAWSLSEPQAQPLPCFHCSLLLLHIFPSSLSSHPTAPTSVVLDILLSLLDS